MSSSTGNQLPRDCTHRTETCMGGLTGKGRSSDAWSHPSHGKAFLLEHQTIGQVNPFQRNLVWTQKRCQVHQEMIPGFPFKDPSILWNSLSCNIHSQRATCKRYNINLIQTRGPICYTYTTLLPILSLTSTKFLSQTPLAEMPHHLDEQFEKPDPSTQSKLHRSYDPFH